VLTRPDGLTDDALAAGLRSAFGVEAKALVYVPVGFGSHHWDAYDTNGERWFVTVDRLPDRRERRDEPNDSVFARLAAALNTAADVQLDFAVAPVDGVARIHDAFCVARYPYLDGQTFARQPYPDIDAVCDMLRTLHAVPLERVPRARRDDFSLMLRDEVERSLVDPPADTGPYASAAAELIDQNSDVVRALYARYDTMVPEVARLEFVVTHGEPHGGNTMLTADGWKLIDWDTALLAPRERDFWHLGDEGTTALDLYRLRWDLTDLGIYVNRLRAPHTGSADDTKSLDELRGLLARYR